jgi:hypothetical protein
MPDVLEILNSMSVDDKALYSESRSAMRRAYLNAHNATVGIGKWENSDDWFLDLIDMKLALLFDKAGLMETSKKIIDNTEAERIEAEIIDKTKQLSAVRNGVSAQPNPNSYNKLDAATGWKS